MHSLQVIDFCNRLIGDQIDKLNADEIPEFKANNPTATTKETIRQFHHEFSGKFIEKYAEIFEIPGEEYDVLSEVKNSSSKLQETLDLCRSATNQRTDFEIRQEKVILEYV